MNTPAFRVGSLFLAVSAGACISHAQVDCVYKELSVSKVQGQVFDPVEKPVPLAAVSLRQGGNEMSRVTTDGEGRFLITTADGEYELHTEMRGFESAFAVINVGNDVAHTFYPSRLWMILNVGAGESCPSVTTNHKQFLQIVSDNKKVLRNYPKNATQK